MTIQEIFQLKKEKADPFLRLFPLNYRGAITNFILAPIRLGINNYDIALSWLEHDLNRRKPLRGSEEWMEKFLHNPALKKTFEYYIFYENLPYETKAAIKKEVMKDFWNNQNKGR